ncbi:hypothetical protein ABK040_014066 [Willaertia magna]
MSQRLLMPSPQQDNNNNQQQQLMGSNNSDGNAVDNNNDNNQNLPRPSQTSQQSNRSIVNPSQQERNKYIMVGNINSAKSVANVLHCINIDKKQCWSICELSNDGIKFYVQDKTFQGIAFLKREIFQNYRYNAEVDHIYFDVNISVLIDCLILYGSNVAQGTIVKLCFPGVDRTLSLLLGDESVVTDCNIKTKEAEDPYDFKFREFEIPSKLILKSEVLIDALSEIDWLAKSVEIEIVKETTAQTSTEQQQQMLLEEGNVSGVGQNEHVNQQQQHPSTLSTQNRGRLVFRTMDNVIGSLEVEVPNIGDAFYSFECNKTQNNTYMLSHIQHCMKALSQSERVCIRMNTEGTLSMQFVIKATEPVTYVEFFLLPMDTEFEGDGFDD